MPARRFFVEGARAVGDVVDISGGDAHKILRVLRLKDGDTIEAVDSAGRLFDATVACDRQTVRATLARILPSPESPAGGLTVELAQAVPKSQKMDFVIEKATELGAAAILPFHSERTVVADVSDAKLQRWRRLAKSSAQQCGRQSVPEIAGVVSYSELVARFEAYDAVLFPWELAPRDAPLRDRLPPLLSAGSRVLAVIGPEGGFTHDEAESARAHGAHLLWLGPRILRTETAGMALLAVIDALAGHSVENE